MALCPAGRYCACMGNGSVRACINQECPRDHFCPRGASAPLPCKDRMYGAYQDDEGSSSCKVNSRCKRGRAAFNPLPPSRCECHKGLSSCVGSGCFDARYFFETCENCKCSPPKNKRVDYMVIYVLVALPEGLSGIVTLKNYEDSIIARDGLNAFTQFFPVGALISLSVISPSYLECSIKHGNMPAKKEMSRPVVSCIRRSGRSEEGGRPGERVLTTALPTASTIVPGAWSEGPQKERSLTLGAGILIGCSCIAVFGIIALARSMRKDARRNGEELFQGGVPGGLVVPTNADDDGNGTHQPSHNFVRPTRHHISKRESHGCKKVYQFVLKKGADGFGFKVLPPIDAMRMSPNNKVRIIIEEVIRGSPADFSG